MQLQFSFDFSDAERALVSATWCRAAAALAVKVSATNYFSRM
jgi:hypothetical protein